MCCLYPRGGTVLVQMSTFLILNDQGGRKNGHNSDGALIGNSRLAGIDVNVRQQSRPLVRESQSFLGWASASFPQQQPSTPSLFIAARPPTSLSTKGVGSCLLVVATGQSHQMLEKDRQVFREVEPPSLTFSQVPSIPSTTRKK